MSRHYAAMTISDQFALFSETNMTESIMHTFKMCTCLMKHITSSHLLPYLSFTLEKIKWVIISLNWILQNTHRHCTLSGSFRPLWTAIVSLVTAATSVVVTIKDAMSSIISTWLYVVLAVFESFENKWWPLHSERAVTYCSISQHFFSNEMKFYLTVHLC